MVQLSLVQSGNTRLVASQPVVAAFVGGTSGIGAHTIRTLAIAQGARGPGFRVYIIGRNGKAAEEILSECRKGCPSGQFHFISANDLALLKDVDTTCAELTKIEEKEAKATGETPRIDILVMSQLLKPTSNPGIHEMVGLSLQQDVCLTASSSLRSQTPETTKGLDTFMCLLFYSRMRFTTRLVPLLLASSLPAHVISVYGPGRDTTFIPDDLSLRSPKNYGFGSPGSHAAYLTTFFMEHLAIQNANKIAFVHYFPGLLLSEVFQDPTFPLWFRAVFRYGAPIIRLSPMTLDGKVSGERTLFNASHRFPPRSADGRPVVSKDGVAESSDGIVGGGAYRVNYNNEQVATGKHYVKLKAEGWLEKVVEHFLRAYEEIEAGRVYTG